MLFFDDFKGLNIICIGKTVLVKLEFISELKKVNNIRLGKKINLKG